MTLSPTFLWFSFKLVLTPHPCAGQRVGNIFTPLENLPFSQPVIARYGVSKRVYSAPRAHQHLLLSTP